MEGKEAPKRTERKVRVPYAEKSLLCFVKALQGMKVVIELRDDVAMRGTLLEVDDRMNCVVGHAVRLTPEGRKQKLEEVYVKSRIIRYVHFPPAVDPSVLVEKKRLEAWEAARHYRAQAVLGPRNPSKAEIEEAERRGEVATAPRGVGSRKEAGKLAAAQR